MRVPTRSEGTRSGVNWMRRNVPPRTSASVLTVSVLASPGTPSSSTWPPASSATSRRSSIASWPTMTRLISWSAASRASRASSKRACCCARAPAPVKSSNSVIRVPSSSSHQPPEPCARHSRPREQQQERAARQARRELALALLRAELRAQPVVDALELARVVGGEGLSPGRPRDVAQALGVRRHAAHLRAARAARPRHLDGALRGAERDRVHGDLGPPGLLRGLDRVLALRRGAV